MNVVSISQLKAHPAGAVNKAADYPLAIQKRNKIVAYLVGKELFEKIVSLIEDVFDRKAIEETDFSKGKAFEKVADQLGL
ncbi:type II toxin-antitoxin system Phd/YefM family antitoxin [Patescibacteria group bacterium]|nr:type II toxin-antitoxin system Phd/YefM family antitoxin [Patescibacteria group bacterium]